jgi:hypothetical protein
MLEGLRKEERLLGHLMALDRDNAEQARKNGILANHETDVLGIIGEALNSREHMSASFEVVKPSTRHRYRIIVSLPDDTEMEIIMSMKGV